MSVAPNGQPRMNLLTLFEMDWYDKSPLVAVLKANRGRWIHFSQGAPNRDYASAKLLPDPVKPTYWSAEADKKYKRELLKVQRQNAIAKVPKIGINPKSIWSDSPGIYMYPVDFLLAGAERIRIAQQHGVDYPNYYLADLNLNDPNGVNLGTVTWDQVTEIARRNGWLDMMVAFREASVGDQKKALFSYSRPDLPGSFLWHFVDRMVKDGKLTWLKAFRGISYIHDPNLAIIHSNEPDQILVINPKVIRKLDMGNNTPINIRNQDKIEHWMFALINIIKTVRGEYGGTLIWEKKVPILRFEKGKGKFELKVTSARTGGSYEMEPGLNMSYTYRRAQNSFGIQRKDLEAKTAEQIVAIITNKVDFVSRLGTDLLFKPIMPIAEGKVWMTRNITNLPDMAITTNIHNDETSKNNRWSSVYLYGKASRDFEGLIIETDVTAILYADHTSLTVRAKFGKADLMYASPQDDDATLDDVAAAVAKNFDDMFEQYAPSRRTAKYRTNMLFSSDAEMIASKGWIVKNCGLHLDGALERHYATEIAAFDDYPKQNNLIKEIRYVLNTKY
jgi:hypothetical protein